MVAQFGGGGSFELCVELLQLGSANTRVSRPLVNTREHDGYRGEVDGLSDGGGKSCVRLISQSACAAVARSNSSNSIFVIHDYFGFFLFLKKLCRSALSLDQTIDSMTTKLAKVGYCNGPASHSLCALVMMAGSHSFFTSSSQNLVTCLRFSINQISGS